MKNPFDDLVTAFGRGEDVDLSSIDQVELLSFACREAYYHIRSRSPDLPDDDPAYDKARCAMFVGWALELALDHASSVSVPG